MSEATDGLEAGFSLADLADIDVTEIEEVRYVAIPIGIYEFEIGKCEMMEDTKDGERRFKIEIPLVITDVISIMEPLNGKEKDDFLKKQHTERFFIYPQKEEKDVLASIGRVRAFVTDVGLPSDGKLGQLVESMTGHTFRGKIVNRPNKDDPTNPYKRLVLDTPKG